MLAAFSPLITQPSEPGDIGRGKGGEPQERKRAPYYCPCPRKRKDRLSADIGIKKERPLTLKRTPLPEVERGT